MTRTAQHPLLRASAVLVHCFARVKWQQVDGGKWKSAGGRVLSDASYKKLQARLKDEAGKGKAAKGVQPPPDYSGKNGGPLLTPEETKAIQAKQAAAGKVPKMFLPRVDSGSAAPAPPPAKPAGEGYAAPPASPRGGGREFGPNRRFGPNYQPPKPAAVPGLAKPLPMPSPAESAYINDAHAKDTKRFGPKVANFLRVGLASAVGILTATNGLAWGAILGTALGGPLGLALGTAIGGGLGGRLGAWAGKKTDRVLGGAGRAAVEVRKAARTVLPKAAAAPIAAVGAIGGIGTSIATTSAGAALGGPLGGLAGAVLGGGMGVQTVNGSLDLAQQVSKATRAKLARSPAAKRKAERVNAQKLFSELERFADPPAPSAPAEKPAPPALDPVALLKARVAAILARQGKPAIQIDDEPIIAALALAAQEEDAAEKTTAMSEVVATLTRVSQRFCRG